MDAYRRVRLAHLGVMAVGVLGVWLFVYQLSTGRLSPVATLDAQAGVSSAVSAPVGDAYAYEAITVSTTAVGFTATTITPTSASLRPATAAIITLETADIRYRYDGTNPTATEGHAAASGSTIVVRGANNVLRFRMIRSGASDATARVTYLR